jgi:hypothetical protein
MECLALARRGRRRLARRIGRQCPDANAAEEKLLGDGERRSELMQRLAPKPAPEPAEPMPAGLVPIASADNSRRAS